MASRAVGTQRPFRQALAKAFAFCDYLFFLVAKSKDLAVLVNKSKPMGIGLNALFAIANVELNLKVASSFHGSLPLSIVQS